ncbi:MAG TPA: ABC transporter ATP-binding protein, partial [bacterium]|nr:ABC transporter ATP-binding protein [bacterium]
MASVAGPASAAGDTASGPQHEPLLSVQGLQAYYGESHILHGVDLEVFPGEVV